MTTARKPQLALRLETTAPDPGSRWFDGAAIAYLGGTLCLALETGGKDARLEGTILHLPLPPQATPRQIQDRAEAWLREAARQKLAEIIDQKSALAGRRTPRLVLSFAARGHWAQADGADDLRCNWRLIEQAVPVIEQVIARAIAALPPESSHTATAADLFGAMAA